MPITPPAIGEEPWGQDLNNQLQILENERIDADEYLQGQIDSIEGADLTQCKARATDGSFGLPAPDGNGFEAIITANKLQDFHMNGVGL